MATLLVNDRKTLLLKALAKQARKCFWCRYEIDHPDNHKQEQVLVDKKYPQHGFYLLRDGLTTNLSLATADHLLPQWAGGQTSQVNIVAACWACNQDRGLLHGPHWYVVDATGFLPWIKRPRKPKSVVRPMRPHPLFGTSLRPLILKALSSGPSVDGALALKHWPEDLT